MRHALAILAFCLAALPAAADRAPITGRATALDGDTLRLEDGRRVRLFGIDAPEMDTTHGPRARALLDDLLRDRPVTCHPTGDTTHGRIVARCTAGDTDLGLALLRQGLATVYRRFTAGTPAAETFDAAERAGRTAGRGLWATAASRNRDYSPFWTKVRDFQSLGAGIFALFAAALTVAGLLAQVHATIKGVKAQIGHAEKQAHDDRMARLRDERRQVLNDRIRLAGAFYGEISGILGLVRERQILEAYQLAGAELRAGHRSTIPKFPIGHDYFIVHRANADRLGIFAPPLPESLASWYTAALGALDYLQAISAGTYDGATNQAAICDHFAGILAHLINSADLLKDELQHVRLRAQAELADLEREEHL